MKTVLQKITLLMVLVLFQLGASAQMVISQAEYNHKIGEDNLVVHNQDVALSAPSHGQGQEWDYSQLPTDLKITHNYLDGSGNSTFKNGVTSRYMMYNAFMNYRVREYYALDGNAFILAGRTQFDTAHTLVGLTGVATDSMKFPHADLAYTGETTALAFPLEYGKKWGGTLIEYTNMILTASPFGLNNAPVEIKRFRTFNYEVVGEGKVYLPTGENTAITIPSLLIKQTETVIDSIFVYGMPATAQLLAPFGVQQGQTFSRTLYTFEMKGLGHSALNLYIDEDTGEPYAAEYRPKAVEIITGLNEVNLASSAEVYPTVLSSGSIINFEFESGVQVGSFALISTNGQRIQITNTASNQFMVPANLAPGFYFYEAVSSNASELTRGRIVVIE